MPWAMTVRMPPAGNGILANGDDDSAGPCVPSVTMLPWDQTGTRLVDAAQHAVVTATYTTAACGYTGDSSVRLAVYDDGITDAFWAAGGDYAFNTEEHPSVMFVDTTNYTGPEMILLAGMQVTLIDEDIILRPEPLIVHVPSTLA